MGNHQLIICLFLPIMLWCSALKIYLLCSILCLRARIIARLYTSLHEQFTTCSKQFIKTVLLECINEWYQSTYTITLYHTMTVLLEYIDRSIQLSIKLMYKYWFYFKYLLLSLVLLMVHYAQNYVGIIGGSLGGMIAVLMYTDLH